MNSEKSTWNFRRRLWMIFKECLPQSTNQTDLDILQTIRYAARINDHARYKLSKKKIDDTRLDATQLLDYVSKSNKASSSTYITSNEIASADDLIVSPRDMTEKWRTIVDEFIEISKQNTRCAKHMKHFVLSQPAHEDLTNAQWSRVATQFMVNLGYENSKWIAFKHDKESNPHLHLVVSRINTLDYKVVPEWQEHERAFEIVREIEKELGLTRLPSPGDAFKPEKQEDGSYKMVPNNAQELNSKYKQPHKNDIVRRINAVNDYFFKATPFKPNIGDWMLALRESGIGVQMTFTDDGTVKGMSYRIKMSDNRDFICSASKLGGRNRFGFNKMKERFVPITDEQLRFAKELSDRETRMRDGHEPDIITHKKLAEISALCKKAFSIQLLVDKEFFNKRLYSEHQLKRNYRVHRNGDKRCISKHFKIDVSRFSPKMTKHEYDAMINIKLAIMLIELLAQFFGFKSNEKQSVQDLLASDNIRWSEVDEFDEYINLFECRRTAEIFPDGRRVTELEFIDIAEFLKNRNDSGDVSDSVSVSNTLDRNQQLIRRLTSSTSSGLDW